MTGGYSGTQRWMRNPAYSNLLRRSSTESLMTGEKETKRKAKKGNESVRAENEKAKRDEKADRTSLAAPTI